MRSETEHALSLMAQYSVGPPKSVSAIGCLELVKNTLLAEVDCACRNSWCDNVGLAKFSFDTLPSWSVCVSIPYPRESHLLRCIYGTHY
jgi:hypothetical protein